MEMPGRHRTELLGKGPGTEGVLGECKAGEIRDRPAKEDRCAGRNLSGITVEVVGRAESSGLAADLCRRMKGQRAATKAPSSAIMHAEGGQ
jgi:hypothetical protein